MPLIRKKKNRSPAPAAVTSNGAAGVTPSPGAVICIDLTDEDSEIIPEKERRLGTVRKELEPRSARKKKRGGLKTTGLENADCEVIIIDSDGDDNASTAADVVSRPTKKARSMIEDFFAPHSGKKKKVKEEPTSGKNKVKDETNARGMGIDNDGFEIVEATAPKVAAATMVAESAAGSCKNTSGDEDVVVEGVINETRLPHMRQHCTRFPFNASRSYGSWSNARKANSQSCDLCYCYVCDCPVKDCKHWHSSTSIAPENNHCCASDKDGKWEKMRSLAKKQTYRDTTTDSDEYESESERGDDELPDDGWCDDCDTHYFDCSCYHGFGSEYLRQEQERMKLSTYCKPGPFKPDNRDAPKDKDLTKCRHCAWYVRLEVCRSSPSSLDWCGHCGRVASEKDLEKEQMPSTNNKADPNGHSYFFMGQKDIPFRIKAHDPRLFEKYKENWKDDGFGSSEWLYDDAERDKEVFLHRLGKSPSFSNIVNAIPDFSNENIPETLDSSSIASSRMNDSSLQEATDAVVIENPEQLQFVHHVASIGQLTFRRTTSSPHLRLSPIRVNASWDKDARSGVFKIQLFLPKYLFLGQNSMERGLISPDEIAVLLGLWFGIFPLQSSQLCGLLNPSSSEDVLNSLSKCRWRTRTYDIPMQPYRVELRSVSDNLRTKIASNHCSLLSAKEKNEKRLTMTPSDGSRFSGGVCTPASSDSFSDSIARYFSEKFFSLIDTSRHNEFVASCFGAIRTKSFQITDAILGSQSALTAATFFEEDIQKHRRTGLRTSIEDTMIRIENLGHESEDCVEGLKIELLDFQRESLKWALEREQIPGGVQSFSWPKLPCTREGQEDLYYNPILKLFRKDKPALVRGGIIAEQMGLGKTVISLALILKNPAPEFPLSGSPISEIRKNDASENCGWDKHLYEKISITNEKTGIVICKGTLVICPVSLVGQWIDEAKSKLKDPGLIYPYYGANRKRDPNILAANSIVVTTYDILKSDAHHHARKAGLGYCPPLQQIRWWRIICDEGHILRESSTLRSKSVLSLVADHKWVVTGTPMNTCHNDLKNQLKFLGFEHVEKIFKAMNHHSRIDMNLLMYFLRPIMMRHNQEQKYRGTTTTLMSLPPKTERKELVRFSTEEEREFKKIEKEAQDWYINFRSANANTVSKHFLKISSKLTPLRISCSGGKYPISSEKYLSAGDDTNKDAMNIDMDVDGSGEKKKAVNVPVYSKFVFESKFKTLLSQLKKIRDKEPDSKSLVFSQFSSTLEWLKLELPKHGFQFRTLSGSMTMTKRAKALSDFQNDPPTTIFLLSLRAGAVGINLTQANRVFLMEPSFNPALEAQAIGRVHRLGQKRPVQIVRLIVKNSLEERMLDFLEQKYGKSSGNRPDVVSENDQQNDDSRHCNGLAGNLKIDKAQLVKEEFDVLFGVKDRLKADTQEVKEKESAKVGDDGVSWV